MKFSRAKRALVGAVGAGVVAAALAVPMAPSNADPDIDDVEKRVNDLMHQAEVAAEQVNDARIELKALKSELKSLKNDESKQLGRLDGAQDAVEDSIVRQYEGEAFSGLAQVVVADNPSEFLSELSAMDEYTSLQTSLFDEYSTELKALELQREETKQRADEVAELTEELAEKKDKIDERHGKAQSILDELEEEEAERILASSHGGATTGAIPAASDIPASGRAKAAINYAMAQVGKSYVYGAMGPNAFDCSGLTMRAFGAAGVGLPHSSRGQAGMGTPVSSSALKPGDLVFYYSPISHVGIYIGGGRIVHAANPGTGVAVTGVHSMPFSGARRI